MKTLLLILLLTAALHAAPSTYYIKKLPPGVTPGMDGTLTEWNDAYFIDSLRSNDNLFASDVPPWTSANFQMMVYGAWDDTKVYFAVRVIRDDIYNICGYDTTTGPCGCDNIRPNPGGYSRSAFYIFSNNTKVFNPSCPFDSTTMEGNCNSYGGAGDTLPSYEFSLALTVLDPFGMRTFLFSIETMDEDASIGSCSRETWVSLGSEYTGPKNYANNSWDFSLYYPTYYLDSTVGPPLGVEGKAAARISAERLGVNPNPFMPSTVISYKALNTGSLKIYDVSGKVVQSFATKAGSANVMWNGTDARGWNVSAGLYIARLTSGRNVLKQRLFLMK
jgi:hypothetical protein